MWKSRKNFQYVRVKISFMIRVPEPIVSLPEWTNKLTHYLGNFIAGGFQNLGIPDSYNIGFLVPGSSIEVKLYDPFTLRPGRTATQKMEKRTG